MSLKSTASVLVVEDSAVQSRLLAGMLGTLGYGNVTIAGDGFAALDLLKTRSFQIIISDWDMPRLSGYQLLLVCRDNSRHHSTCFIMSTANSSEAAKAKAQRAGVSGYLVKPYGQNDLATALEASC